MDEFLQIALFVLFALFSLGSNLLNKRKKQQAETRRAEEETEADTRRPHPGRPHRRAEVSSPDEPEAREQQPTTFEDILRELTGESPRPRRRAEPKVEEEIEDDYEHPFSSRKPKEEAKGLGRQAEQKAEPIRKYTEQAKKKPEQAARRGDARHVEVRRISDKINIDDTRVTKKLEVKTAKRKAKSKSLAQSIATSLKDGQNARKAIILSEIINRKHF